LLHWRSTLQVLRGGFDVEVNFLLAQVDHMAREERLAVLLEIFLIRSQEAIQPWQKLLGTVVGVQDNWDAIGGRNTTDVVGSSNSTSNRGFLVAIGDALLHNSSTFIDFSIVEV
jgi:hypothetical protein